MPVQRVEALDGFARFAEVQAAVGEHAVHIKKGHAHALGAQQQLGVDLQGRGRGGLRRLRHRQITFARMRSPMCTTPTSTPAASSTSTLVMACASIISAASTARASGAIRRGLGVHDLGGRGCAQVRPGLDAAAQVAVGEDAQHLPGSIDDGRGAQALGAHLAHEVAERGIGGHARHLGARAHHVAHVGEQLAAQRTAGVRAGKVFGAEAPGVQQGHGQRIAHGQLGRGAGGGGQVAGGRLRAPRCTVQHQVGITSPGWTAGRPVMAISGGAQAPQHGQDGREFIRFRRCWRCASTRSIARDHAQVAMAGLGGVYKKGGGAGGCERGSNLAAHMATFAHAHHHHTAHGHSAALHLYGLRAMTRHRRGPPVPGQGRSLDIKGFAGQAQGLVGIKRGQRGGGGSHPGILSTGHARRALPTDALWHGPCIACRKHPCWRTSLG